MYLENSSAMDALTGWIKKIVEIPVEERPSDLKKFMVENWNPKHGNILNTAVANALKMRRDQLASVLEENCELKRKIVDLESKLLIKRVAAIEVKKQKQTASSPRRSEGKSEAVDPTGQSKDVVLPSDAKPEDIRNQMPIPPTCRPPAVHPTNGFSRRSPGVFA
ncbi:hypothetical protein Q1695_015441 [Nippostrongylus brasiliensis]|nr:hypothetical protein Q1695_015441 [Nippostrongylus brasiliensis]